MQQVDPSSPRITDRPIGLWIFGGLFAAVGVFIILNGPWLFGLIFLAAGLAMALLPSALTIRVDRAGGVIELTYRRLFNTTRKVIAITDLRGVDIESSRSSDGTTYRVSLVQGSGERVPLHSYYSSGYRAHQRRADQLREMLGLPEGGEGAGLEGAWSGGGMPQAAFEPADKGESGGVSWTLERGMLGGLTLLRWSSAGLSFPGRFLALLQKPAGSGGFLSGKLLAGVSGAIYKSLLALYGFDTASLPNLDLARPYPLDGSPAGSDFSAYTCDAELPPRLLTPWAVQALLGWSKRHPLRALSANGSQVGQLVVLFNEHALSLVVYGAAEGMESELIETGIALAKEAKAVA